MKAFRNKISIIFIVIIWIRYIQIHNLRIDKSQFIQGSYIQYFIDFFLSIYMFFIYFTDYNPAKYQPQILIVVIVSFLFYMFYFELQLPHITGTTRGCLSRRMSLLRTRRFYTIFHTWVKRQIFILFILIAWQYSPAIIPRKKSPRMLDRFKPNPRPESSTNPTLALTLVLTLALILTLALARILALKPQLQPQP